MQEKECIGFQANLPGPKQITFTLHLDRARGTRQEKQRCFMEVFLAFGGGETLSPLKDILVGVWINVFSVFQSKISCEINTSFTFSMKCPLVI